MQDKQIHLVVIRFFLTLFSELSKQLTGQDVKGKQLVDFYSKEGLIEVFQIFNRILSILKSCELQGKNLESVYAGMQKLREIVENTCEMCNNFQKKHNALIEETVEFCHGKQACFPLKKLEIPHFGSSNLPSNRSSNQERDSNKKSKRDETIYLDITIVLNQLIENLNKCLVFLLKLKLTIKGDGIGKLNVSYDNRVRKSADGLIQLCSNAIETMSRNLALLEGSEKSHYDQLREPGPVSR